VTAVQGPRPWLSATASARPAEGVPGLPDRYARLLWLAALLVAVVWAVTFAHAMKYPAQRVWGSLAAVAYALAALAAVVLPRRWIPASVTAISLIGAVLVPLLLLTAAGKSQSEVAVVERSAQLLLHNGHVYLPDPQTDVDYNPYLPAMSVFGLPHQLLDQHPPRGLPGTVLVMLGDARIWFALVFLACLFASWRLLRRGTTDGERRPVEVRALLALIGGPLVAVPLCVSGVDLPIIGLSCLALACAARGWGLATGAVAALTCALKWTAWPLLPVAALLVLMRRGPRQALWCTLIGVGATALSIVPFALNEGRAMVEQVATFPLGLAHVHTPAASPLPGHLLAEVGTGGRVVGLVLLAASCGAVAVWTLRRPPSTAVQATNRLAAGLSVAFAFAPSGRFGYFALPVMLWLLPLLADGTVQIVIPYWKRGRPLRVVLTLLPSRPATSP
jgi:Glycosyltransferase family 87